MVLKDVDERRRKLAMRLGGRSRERRSTDLPNFSRWYKFEQLTEVQ